MRGYFRSLAKRSLTVIVIWNVVIGCIVGTFVFLGLLFAGQGATVAPTYTYVYGSGEEQLLSIPVNGVITGTEAPADSLFGAFDVGQTAGYSVKEKLYIAAEDPNIKGVILEIDSPGGTIFGSRAIVDGVAYYQRVARRPVYAHISGSGASGAYWAAISADKVLVDPGSDVGSIGVIMGPFEYYDKVIAQDGGILGGGVITENGIESMYLTAGESKDAGNPYRKLTEEELRVMQQSVNNEYDQFVEYVSNRRLLAPEVIRQKIKAMVYDSKTAKELKLVDEVVNRQDAYDLLAQAAGVEDNYQVITEQYVPGFAASLLGAVRKQPHREAQATDLCTLTGTTLVYHGDVTGWCKE